jgi:rubrerythrin
MQPIQSAAELYAHAIAIEREAAQRYSEFAVCMADAGNLAVAEVFETLARLEADHLEALLLRTAGVTLPRVAAERYRWLDSGAPETGARELVFRTMTSRNALFIALTAEIRAQAFFERVLLTAADPALRALAREMANDEVAHIVLIEKLLERTPEPLSAYLKGENLV